MFCPNCNNFFDIASTNNNLKTNLDNNNDSSTLSDTYDTLKGGIKYQSLIQKLLDNQIEDNHIKNIDGDSLVNSSEFSSLTNENKNYIYGKIKKSLSNENKELFGGNFSKNTTDIFSNNMPFFICKNCNTKKPIKPKSVLYSKTYKNKKSNYTIGNFDNMLHSDILLRTREYTCPNDKCPTHKNYTLKEAVMFRMYESYKIKYICTACKTDF